MAVYLTSIYSNANLESWFVERYKEAGKKLDIGKSCVRFKSIDQLPVELIGEAIGKVSLDEFLATYRSVKG